MTLPGFAPAPPAPGAPPSPGDRVRPQLDTHCATLCSQECADLCEDRPPWEAGDCLGGCQDRCLRDCEPPTYLLE
ncbi:hypothetical protein ABT354_12455 [Streptomyces sp. NPDC000594]|uniref:hypothetical protein n=1 Tax=Streptomyces sp. NPDC000594 TaxID=3154261 RepID=UPI00332F7F0B